MEDAAGSINDSEEKDTQAGEQRRQRGSKVNDDSRARNTSSGTDTNRNSAQS